MYPPWAFFTNFLVFPPLSVQHTRWYYALLDTISLVVLGVFSYQIGQPYGKLKAWFSVVTCFSISGLSNPLGIGQYGIIINALLIGMFWLIQKHRDILAGLLFGLALVKPNISALFFFILIIRQRYVAVIACFFYISFASLAIWMLTKVSPFYMLAKMITASKYFGGSGYSGVNVLINFGLETTIATVLLALVMTVTLVAILYVCRHYSLLTLFATAAVLGRIWTYHRAYDNVMLIFLLLALLKMTLGKPNTGQTHLNLA